MFLSRSIERQAGHDKKMLLLIDSMIELLTLYDIITYILRKMHDNVFQFTFQKKKRYVIKDSKANKRDRH